MKKIKKEILKKICSKIEELEKFNGDFIGLSQNEIKECFDSYNCYRAFDKIIIHNECYSPNIERTFYLYDEQTNILRQLEEDEDEIIRAYDDEFPVMDRTQNSLFFIICKNGDNSIDKGNF